MNRRHLVALVAAAAAIAVAREPTPAARARCRWSGMARRRLLVLLAALATAAATLVVSQPQPVAAVGSASIRVSVANTPRDGTDIGFVGCQATSCGPFTLDDDGSTDLTHPPSVTAEGLAPGTYTVTQDSVPGWTLTSLTCSPGTAVTTDLASRRVTIALAAGATVNCSFQNQSPSIEIVQDTSPNDAADIAYTGCLGTGCASFALDDDADPVLTRSLAAGGLAPGTYTITQSPPAPWALASITCNTTSGVTTDVGQGRATIVLSRPTDHRICTFTDKTQSITFVENDLSDSGTDFQFTGCGGGGCAGYTLDDDSDPTLASQTSSGPISTGTYTITQDAVAGWELTDLTCTGGSTDLLSRTGTVTLTAGQDRTCTFTNRPSTEPLTNVADVTVGDHHVCARLTDGQARCWGNDALGDGTAGATTAPQVVLDPSGTGPLGGVVDIAAGGSHTCAALEDGSAVCWGSDSAGQLGNGTPSGPALTPTVVLDEEGGDPLAGVVAVAAGSDRSCAVLETGEARCWGDGTSGALGNRSFAASALPVRVMNGTSPLADVAEIVTGLQFTCARIEDGTARCWGYGATGTRIAASFSPLTVETSDLLDEGPLTGITSISGNWSHACAHSEGGEIACWGGGVPSFSGQSAPTPVPVRGRDGTPIHDARSVADGERVTCAAQEDGTAACWGAGPEVLGGGPTVNGWASQIIVVDNASRSPLSDVGSVAAGHDTACAVLNNGEARCWGRVTGDGTGLIRAYAVPVVAP